MCYITILHTSSGYHNLKIDKKPLYLTMIACHCGRCKFTRLQFAAVLAGDMFQQKIDHFFKDLPNVFGTVEDIVIVGYHADGRDHDRTIRKVMQICH